MTKPMKYGGTAHQDGVVKSYKPVKASKPDLTVVTECFIVVNGLREVASIIASPVFGPLVGNVLKFDGTQWFGLYCKTPDPLMAEDAGNVWLDGKYGEKK